MNFKLKKNIEKENYKKIVAWACAVCFVLTFVCTLSMIIIGKFVVAAITLIISCLSFVYSRKYFGTNKEDEKISTD